MIPSFQGVPLIDCRDLAAGEAIAVGGGLGRKLTGHWNAWEVLLQKAATLSRLGDRIEPNGPILVNFEWLRWAVERQPVEGWEDFVQTLKPRSRFVRRTYEPGETLPAGDF
jgi:hypothetical protein